MRVKLDIPRANTGGVLGYAFTLELKSFDLHIILYIAKKLYKIEWLIYHMGSVSFVLTGDQI